MKTKLRFMAFVLLGMMLSVNQVWAKEGDIVSSTSNAGLAGSSTSYGTYSNDYWVMTVCNNSAFGTNAKSSNDSKLKLSYCSSTASDNTLIAAAIAAYTKTEFSTGTQYVSALIGKTKLKNVGKVTITYTGTNGGTPDNIWVVATTKDGCSVVGSTTTMTSPIDISFSTIDSAKYAVVAKRSSAFGLKGATFYFYEGTASTKTAV